MPTLPESVPSAEQTFQEMQFTDLWPEASMTKVCHYLRGGMHLRIPPTFLTLLPTKL